MFPRLRRLALAGPLLAAPLAAQEPSLAQILQSHYAAIGGLEKWQAVQSFKATGRMSLGQGMEAPFTMTAKRPLMARIEFTFQGMTGIQAFDGQTGWMIMPFMGKTDPEPMPADETKDMAENADIDGPLVNHAEKGHQVELVGKTEIEGTAVYKLKVTLKTGDVRYHYLDAEHYLTLRVEGRRSIQGTETEFEQILSDYKDVGGLLIPHSIENRMKGAPGGQVLTIDSIELNVTVDNAVFAMPKKEGSE